MRLLRKRCRIVPAGGLRVDRGYFSILKGRTMGVIV
jgi:hypothetical protein